MSSTLFNDIKQLLRKKDFPYSVREALKKADELLRSSSNGWGQKERHMDFISEIVSEFVFRDNAELRNKRKTLSHREELELMLAVLDHIVFDSPKNSSLRNAMFLLLFPSHKPQRLKFLVLLSSLALSCSIIPVLNSAAVLLQQVGFSSVFSRNFATCLVDDYFMLVSSTTKPVHELPVTAPLFAANFITALTESYKHDGLKKEPPLELTEIIMDWIRSSKMFLFSPLITRYQAALPPGSIPMPPVTPYAGLLRWWAIGYSRDKNKGLYREMGELLMDTLRLSSDLTTSATLFTSNDIISLLMIFKEENCSMADSLDVFAHILSTILQTNTLYINTQDFWKILSRLPKNHSKLLDSIISQNMTY